jgi:hypothetical protein
VADSRISPNGCRSETFRCESWSVSYKKRMQHQRFSDCASPRATRSKRELNGLVYPGAYQ